MRPIPRDHRPSATPTRRQLLQGTAAALLLGGLTQRASAVTFSKPLRLTLGFSAGGGADLIARMLGATMSPILGQPVIVDNKAGAGGRLAVMAVKAAEPDGSTLFFGSTSVLTLFPHVFTGLQYDLYRDYTPVSTACWFPYAVVVSPNIGVTDVAGLAAWVKANPAKAFFGTPGVGTPQHLIGSLLGKELGVPLTHLPFKSGGEATQQLLAGELPIAVATAGQFYGLHRSGRVRMVATTGRNRAAAMSSIPTFTEQGMPALQFEDSFGFVGPANLPDAERAALSQCIAQTIKTAAVDQGLRKQDMEPLLIQDAAYATYLREERDRWGTVVRDLKFTPTKD